MNALIRHGDPKCDASECARIYAPYVTDSWVSFELEAPNEAEMTARMVRYGASHQWLVAEVDNRLAGFAYASHHRERAAYFASCDVTVYVAQEAQGRGIGKALYADLLGLLSKDFHAAFAGIALPNDASIRLHESMGFEPIGVYRQVGWKMGEWRDVGWWQRLL